MTGRPPIFQTPEQFEQVANAYFKDRDSADKPYTVNGLALALGMTRETLLRYGEKDGFSDTVKAVRAKLEAHWEERLAGNAAAGTIFWLKNQGWTDRQVLAGDPEAPVVVQAIERRIVKPD